MNGLQMVECQLDPTALLRFLRGQGLDDPAVAPILATAPTPGSRRPSAILPRAPGACWLTASVRHGYSATAWPQRNGCASNWSRSPRHRSRRSARPTPSPASRCPTGKATAVSVSRCCSAPWGARPAAASRKTSFCWVPTTPRKAGSTEPGSTPTGCGPSWRKQGLRRRTSLAGRVPAHQPATQGLAGRRPAQGRAAGTPRGIARRHAAHPRPGRIRETAGPGHRSP